MQKIPKVMLAARSGVSTHMLASVLIGNNAVIPASSVAVEVYVRGLWCCI